MNYYDGVVILSQEPHKSKKVQHANAKNAVLFEAINLIVHLQRSVELCVFTYPLVFVPEHKRIYSYRKFLLIHIHLCCIASNVLEHSWVIFVPLFITVKQIFRLGVVFI